MRLVLFVAVLALVPLLRADRAEDLARIHIEAVGGRERIDALEAFEAKGHVIAAGGKQVGFTLTAARPNRLRLETEGGGRTLVQGTDGVEPPWEFDTGTWPPKYRPMADNVAKTFAADAEFDDPLIAGEARGFTVEYAGEIEAGGRKFLRLLVTRQLTETFSVLLDADTFLIAKRVEHRQGLSGRKVQVVTHYEDFRPVDGVLLPHQITTAIDERVTQQIKITRIRANPELSPATFSRPKPAEAAERN